MDESDQVVKDGGKLDGYEQHSYMVAFLYEVQIC